MNSASAAVAAERDISRLVYGYCRALDRLDPALLSAVFDEGAYIDLGEIYRGPVAGFIAVAMGFMGAMIATRHEVTNLLIELEGGHAVSETYVRAWHRLAGPGGDEELIVLARYLNEFVRRDDGWLISSHAEVMDWGATHPVAPAWFESNTELPHGERDASDHSYGYFARLSPAL